MDWFEFGFAPKSRGVRRNHADRLLNFDFLSSLQSVNGINEMVEVIQRGYSARLLSEVIERKEFSSLSPVSVFLRKSHRRFDSMTVVFSLCF
jgi:hypothetical protein